MVSSLQDATWPSIAWQNFKRKLGLDQSAPTLRSEKLSPPEGVDKPISEYEKVIGGGDSRQTQKHVTEQ